MKATKIFISTFLLLFGVVSIFMTTSIIFDLFGIREKEGNFVYFIIYANLICGLIYLFVAYLIWKNIKVATYGLALASLILVSAFAVFLNYINQGGVYETKTVFAMGFRSSITIILMGISFYLMRKETINIY